MRISSMWPGQLLRPPPALREVHFWCVFPDEVDGSLLKHYEKLLSPEELADIPKARTQKLQTGRLLARTLVRSTLARYVNGAVDPSSLKFEKNSFGKPKVIWPALTTDGRPWQPPGLSFNLSHTTSIIACAVALDSAVGVDVEEKDRKLSSKLTTFARKKLSSTEADWLQDFTDTRQQRHSFLQLWTLKESYVKAVGKGISGVPFKDFAFGLETSPEAREFLRKVMELPADSQAKLITLDLARSVAQREEAASSWKFVLFEPTPDHIASICVEDKQLLHDDSTHPFQVKAWKTIPMNSDECLHEGALGLGISQNCNFSLF
ncbi:4'-phosphopantetheinyl transferase [Marchantia polymorpha subsp. ruderalis]